MLSVWINSSQPRACRGGNGLTARCGVNWPGLRLSASAHCSASSQSRFSTCSIFRRKCSSPARSRSGGTCNSGERMQRARLNGRGMAKRSQLFGAPRPVVAHAHGHQRNSQFRGQEDRSGGHLPPRSAGAVGRDRQVHVPALVQELPQGRHSAAVGRAADEFEPHVVGDIGQDLGIAVPAQEHRQVAVSPHRQRQEDVLVPEDIDLLTAAPRRGRIDVRIVEHDPIVERIHPCADGRGTRPGPRVCTGWDGRVSWASGRWTVRKDEWWTVDGESVRMVVSANMSSKSFVVHRRHHAPSTLLPLPFPAEDFHRRAGHVDVPVFGPMQLEVAAGQMGENLPLGPAAQHAGHADGAGPRAAGQGNSPLPRSHVRIVTSCRLWTCTKCDVDPAAEISVAVSKNGPIRSSGS